MKSLSGNAPRQGCAIRIILRPLSTFQQCFSCTGLRPLVEVLWLLSEFRNPCRHRGGRKGNKEQRLSSNQEHPDNHICCACFDAHSVYMAPYATTMSRRTTRTRAMNRCRRETVLLMCAGVTRHLLLHSTGQGFVLIFILEFLRCTKQQDRPQYRRQTLCHHNSTLGESNNFETHCRRTVFFMYHWSSLPSRRRG